MGLEKEFILMIVHRLRTSLAGLKWSLKMLTNGDFGGINGEQKDVLGKIYTKNNKIIDLVGDLFDLTTIKEGTKVYNMKLCDVADIIKSVIGDYDYEIRSKNIKLDFNRKDGASTITLLDKNAMEAAIQNIFDNAIRYTSNNGEIKLSLVSREEEIEIKIQDFGPGMPDIHVKKNLSDMGIGLYVSKNIINAHKGKIWFESQNDRKRGATGTIFFITLPILLH